MLHATRSVKNGPSRNNNNNNNKTNKKTVDRRSDEDQTDVRESRSRDETSGKLWPKNQQKKRNFFRVAPSAPMFPSLRSFSNKKQKIVFYIFIYI